MKLLFSCKTHHEIDRVIYDTESSIERQGYYYYYGQMDPVTNLMGAVNVVVNPIGDYIFRGTFLK